MLSAAFGTCGMFSPALADENVDAARSSVVVRHINLHPRTAKAAMDTLE
jgi:hypothetical protein